MDTAVSVKHPDSEAPRSTMTMDVAVPVKHPDSDPTVTVCGKPTKPLLDDYMEDMDVAATGKGKHPASEPTEILAAAVRGKHTKPRVPDSDVVAEEQIARRQSRLPLNSVDGSLTPAEFLGTLHVLAGTKPKRYDELCEMNLIELLESIKKAAAEVSRTKRVYNIYAERVQKLLSVVSENEDNKAELQRLKGIEYSQVRKEKDVWSTEELRELSRKLGAGYLVP